MCARRATRLLAGDERAGSRQQLRIDGNNDRAQRHECGTDGGIEQDPPGVGDAGCGQGIIGCRLAECDR